MPGVMHAHTPKQQKAHTRGSTDPYVQRFAPGLEHGVGLSLS